MAFSLDEAKRLREEAHREDRLYPLVSDGSYKFFTGILPDETQVIVFWDYTGRVRGSDQVVFLRFSNLGDYQGFQKLTLQEPVTSGVSIEERKRIVHEALKAEFDFSPRLIRVKRFAETAWDISIEPLVALSEEFIENPDEFFGDQEPGSREALKEEELEFLKRWFEEKQFVFNCGNDFWVDDTGEVTDS